MQITDRAHHALLAIGVVTFVMMGAGASVYGPALPEFQRSLGLTGQATGLLISAHWVGCAFGVGGMYFKGAAWGPRHALAPMAFGAALVMAEMGVGVTMLGAFLFGAGYGCATAVFNPRILRAFGPLGGAMVSLLNATFAFGAIAIPLVFVWLGRSIPATFGLVAAVTALCWIMAGWVAKGPAAPPATAGLFKPRLGLMTLAVVSIGLEASLIGLGPVALIATGVSEDDAARLLSLFFVTFLVARIVLVFVANRIAPFTVYLLALIGSAICGIGAATYSPAGFFVAIGACVGLFFPGFYVAASRVMGDDPRVSPTIIGAGLVGGILAPIILGFVLPSLGGTGFFWVVGLASLCTALAGVLFARASLRA
jgi:MFS transporter, FHS family, glucose/mannose:H+ symporter